MCSKQFICFLHTIVISGTTPVFILCSYSWVLYCILTCVTFSTLCLQLMHCKCVVQLAVYLIVFSLFDCVDNKMNLYIGTILELTQQQCHCFHEYLQSKGESLNHALLQITEVTLGNSKHHLNCLTKLGPHDCALGTICIQYLALCGVSPSCRLGGPAAPAAQAYVTFPFVPLFKFKSMSASASTIVPYEPTIPGQQTSHYALSSHSAFVWCSPWQVSMSGQHDRASHVYLPFLCRLRQVCTFVCI